MLQLLSPSTPSVQWGNYTWALQQENSTHIVLHASAAGSLPGSCGVRGAVCVLAFFWFILPASGWSFSQHIAGQVDLSTL